MLRQKAPSSSHAVILQNGPLLHKLGIEIPYKTIHVLEEIELQSSEEVKLQPDRSLMEDNKSSSINQSPKQL